MFGDESDEIDTARLVDIRVHAGLASHDSSGRCQHMVDVAHTLLRWVSDSKSVALIPRRKQAWSAQLAAPPAGAPPSRQSTTNRLQTGGNKHGRGIVGTMCRPTQGPHFGIRTQSHPIMTNRRLRFSRSHSVSLPVATTRTRTNSSTRRLTSSRAMRLESM